MTRVEMESTTEGGPVYDLRALFKSVGRFAGQRALEVAPTERVKVDVEVEMLDAASSTVSSTPLDVHAFVDGVQATLSIAHREQRPVYLYYAAAGALGRGAVAVGLREKLSLVCSDADAAWVSQLGGGIPIEQMANASPPELERNAFRLVGLVRDTLERELVGDLLEEGCETLVLDGSLTGRPTDRRLVGVVKSTQRIWLSDESLLWRLEEGWRSPRFKIPAGASGSGMDRYSCYVQMTDKRHGAWNEGLIRLESFDADTLDALAARCLAERQGSRSGDRRWDRHLASVRATEEFLRSRRPSIFAH